MCFLSFSSHPHSYPKHVHDFASTLTRKTDYYSRHGHNLFTWTKTWCLVYVPCKNELCLGFQFAPPGTVALAGQRPERGRGHHRAGLGWPTGLGWLRGSPASREPKGTCSTEDGSGRENRGLRDGQQQLSLHWQNQEKIHPKSPFKWATSRVSSLPQGCNPARIFLIHQKGCTKAR